MLFAVPESGLLPGAEYDVTLSGLASGAEHLPETTLSFTTAGSPLAAPRVLWFGCRPKGPSHRGMFQKAPESNDEGLSTVLERFGWPQQQARRSPLVCLLVDLVNSCHKCVVLSAPFA